MKGAVSSTHRARDSDVTHDEEEYVDDKMVQPRGWSGRRRYAYASASTTAGLFQAVRIRHVVYEGHLNSAFLAEAVGRCVRSSWRDVQGWCR
jgi:hypothetical protein